MSAILGWSGPGEQASQILYCIVLLYFLDIPSMLNFEPTNSYSAHCVVTGDGVVGSIDFESPSGVSLVGPSVHLKLQDVLMAFA